MQHKQRAALEIVVNMAAHKRGMTMAVVIDATLKAARMTPDALYKQIRRYGYKWSVRYQRWTL